MRKKKEPKFIQIAADPDALFALDEDGRVWEYVCGVWQALKTTRRED